MVARGTIRAQFDNEQKLELFDFTTQSYEEFLPRRKVIAAATPQHAWNKEWLGLNNNSQQSPELSKKGKPRPLKSPSHPPPDIDLPQELFNPNRGTTDGMAQFLEVRDARCFATLLVAETPKRYGVG